MAKFDRTLPSDAPIIEITEACDDPSHPLNGKLATVTGPNFCCDECIEVELIDFVIGEVFSWHPGDTITVLDGQYKVKTAAAQNLIEAFR